MKQPSAISRQPSALDGEHSALSTQHSAGCNERLRGPDVACAALILLGVLIVGGPGISKGGLGWSDAPQHTFDGILILELFKQWPIHDLRAWAEQFYLKYPALGILVYWPPGFAVVEAAIFAVFGVSIAAARATVLLYAFAAGLLMFALGWRWFDRWTGLLAALLLITCAHGSLWMNDVMLEWPATFWILWRFTPIRWTATHGRHAGRSWPALLL